MNTLRLFQVRNVFEVQKASAKCSLSAARLKNSTTENQILISRTFLQALKRAVLNLSVDVVRLL